MNAKESYSADLTKIAEMVQGVTTNVVELGCSMIAEEWGGYATINLRKT